MLCFVVEGQRTKEKDKRKETETSSSFRCMWCLWVPVGAWGLVCARWPCAWVVCEQNSKYLVHICGAWDSMRHRNSIFCGAPD